MIYTSQLFHFKNLTHGFTSKEEGNFKEKRNLLKRRLKNFVFPQQIHQNKVAIIDKRNRNKTIKGVDGLAASQKGLILGVTTADCLPILFYEPKKKIVAACHAGWKGSLKRISQKVVEKIMALGGQAEETKVVIGPHIKKCCYYVDKERAAKFKKEFDNQVIIHKNGKLFLDLAKVNLLQLLESGVRKFNIEFLPFCTSCDGRFFSYRKDKENYGEMLSFIGGC